MTMIGVPAVAASTAAAATTSCTGSTRTWDGNGDGFSWSDGANWGGQAPGPDDTAVVPGGDNAPQVEVEASTSTCDLQVGSRVSLTVDTGQTLTAQSTEVVGGIAGSPTSLLGDFSADALDVGAGETDYSSVDSLPTVDEIAVNGAFTLQPGSEFRLSDNSVALDVTGTATLGGSGDVAHLDGNSSSDSDASPSFNLDGTLTLAGNVDSDSLDLTPTATSDINLAAHFWNVTADSFARFPDGMSITSSPAGGAMEIAGEYHLLLSGTTSVGTGATLGLGTNAVISDGNWFTNNGVIGTIAGPGHFSWSGGELVGDLVLGSNLVTVVTGSQMKSVADPNQFGETLVANRGTVDVMAGTLNVQDSKDTFENAGFLTVTGGAVAENASDAPPYLNANGAVWTVDPSSGAVSKMPAASLTNSGTLIVDPEVKLAIGNTFRQTSSGTTDVTISSASSHSTVTASALALSGALHVSSAARYKPRPLLTVKGVLSATGARSGKFARVESLTHRSHTKWRAAYAGKKVNAVLVHG